MADPVVTVTCTVTLVNAASVTKTLRGNVTSFEQAQEVMRVMAMKGFIGDDDAFYPPSAILKIVAAIVVT